MHERGRKIKNIIGSVVKTAFQKGKRASLYRMDDTRKSDLFIKKVTSPSQRRSKLLYIHGGIPCNLAPAHFTVHIAYAIKLRSRVCRGGESCMRFILACCVFMYLYCLHLPAASTPSGGSREIGSAVCSLRSPFL